MWRSGRHGDIPFFWDGKVSGEFKLKRRPTEQSTLLMISTTGAASTLSVLFSSSAPGQAAAWVPATNIVTSGQGAVALVPTDVTHVRIDADGGSWSARTLDASALPEFDDDAYADGASDEPGSVFGHRLGPVHVTVFCQETLTLTLLQLCDCAGSCENERHRTPTPIATIEPTLGRAIQLPEAPGVVVALSSSSWSILPTEDASDSNDASNAADATATFNTDDAAGTADPSVSIPALVRAEVARLLPALVAEQLAALGVGNRRQVPPPRSAPRRDDVPSWFRDARDAVDDFENQLTTIDLAPEPVGDMRRYQWIATEALEKATRILDEAGKKDQSAEVYAALGRGRGALARLDALRHGRPVPLEVLTREELSGPPIPDHTVHTAERLAWQGTDAADFYLDRPLPHRTVLLEVLAEGSDSWIDLALMERTDAIVTERHSGTCFSNTAVIIPAAPSITHVKIVNAFVPWSVRAVDPDRYPFIEDMTRRDGSQIFRHRLGAIDVTIQCLERFALTFYKPCDCTKTCTNHQHQQGEPVVSFPGETRDHCRLPKHEGLLAITTPARWSLDLTPPPSSAR